MLQQCGSPQHFMSHMPPFQKSPKRFEISLPGFSPHFSELECNFYSKKTGACCHAGNTTDTLGPWEHHLDHRVCPMYMYKENILEPLGRPWTLCCKRLCFWRRKRQDGHTMIKVYYQQWGNCTTVLRPLCIFEKKQILSLRKPLSVWCLCSHLRANVNDESSTESLC